MSLPDIGGLIGVAMMLIAYALGQLGRLRIDALPALLMNLVGASLVMISLRQASVRPLSAVFRLAPGSTP